MHGRKRFNYQDRIVVDPDILTGKPVVKGTRIPVELVLKRLSQDLDIQTLMEAYPRSMKTRRFISPEKSA